jgi:3-methyladenine DNA glycosylase AlkC
MAEPFKNIFNPELIARMAGVLYRVSPAFDAQAFREYASDGLGDLEMMARSDQISKALDVSLSGKFLENLDTLIRSLHPTKTAELSDMQTDEAGIAGWAIVPLASYVARNGMDHPEQSLDALREMTMRFSTEFAVRFFLRDHSELAFSKAKSWALDENHHVRRLSSEGTRPLLPWGIKLHQFVEDPVPLMSILTQLRDDPSDYVRKSVANNLNDVSKNHPDLVAGIAVEWLRDAPSSRRRLVKHACRSLIKAGHPETLRAFGYTPPQLSEVRLTIPDHVTLGDIMPIEIEFIALADQKLLIDYTLHFMRANGALSPKVFKWTEAEIEAGSAKKFLKNHPYKQVTTRKDYPGTQILCVQVNGVEITRREFSFSI